MKTMDMMETAAQLNMTVPAPLSKNGWIKIWINAIFLFSVGVMKKTGMIKRRMGKKGKI